MTESKPPRPSRSETPHRISRRSAKRRAITPATRGAKTPSALTTPIGDNIPPGCAARVLTPCPNPQTVGLYLAACVDGGRGTEPISVATLERRLSGICWRYRQLGEPLDTRDRHISTVLAGIRRAHGRPPIQKEAIFTEDLRAMLATLDNDLRGLRDKAILAIGFAGGLRRSEIVGLDCGPNQSEDGTGWIEIFARAEASTPGVNPHAKPPREEKDDAAPKLARQTKAACC